MQKLTGIIFKQILLIMAVYALIRLTFFINNYELFTQYSMAQILWAFIVGLRFDLAAILMINTTFILLWYATPEKWKVKKIGLTIFCIYLIVNSLFIFMSMADTEYFNFTGRRVSWEIFSQSHEVANQFIQMAIFYWKHLIASLLLITLFVISAMRLVKYPRALPSKSSLKKRIQVIGQFILVVIGLILGIRGGLQLKPIKPINAYVFGASELGLLALNSSFTLLTSYSQRSLQLKRFFASRAEVKALMPEPFEKGSVGSSGDKRENLVLIVLESFASEYMGAGNSYKGFTPFLDELTKKGVFFSNHFANGRRSIEAIPAIVAGIPSLMGESFVTSKYQGNKWKGLGSYLKERGYLTSFFHGGENGTMFFDRFASEAGFEHYYGLDEYPNAKRDFDGSWGVFDGPYLKYFIDKLNHFTHPFASLIFTLSSHQPYSIPSALKGKYPKGSLDIHESIGYVDAALRDFFKLAEKQKWYNNTLFIITADHTQKSDRPKYDNPLGRFRVPLLFYRPGRKLPPVNKRRVTSHLDILPSVLDLFAIPTSQAWPFGTSVFNLNDGGLVVNQMPGGKWMVTGDHYVEMRGDTKFTYFRYNGDVDIEPDMTGSEEARKIVVRDRLKAYLQLYINGMVHNNWTK